MGFVFALLYLATAYLGPATLFGPLAAYHIGIILAVIVLLVSLPSLQGSFIWKTPQSLALIGLALATFLSLLVTGWVGGAVQVLLDFIPNAFAYFLLCLHFNSMKKLRILVFMLLAVCLFVIANGYNDLRHQEGVTYGEDESPPEMPYLLPQRSDTGEWFYRIRGQDFINDPNDFAQLIVCEIPLVFLFWRPKRAFLNFILVIVPVSILLFGAYLTHSRGSVLALLAMTIVAARRKIGTVPSVLLAVGMFVGASALNYTGGRDISAESGAGRMDLWAAGLQLLESHPIFGVGFNRMADYAGLTAHNSVVVCAAELGLFGLFFWSFFLFPTVRDTLAIASSNKVTEPDPNFQEVSPFPGVIAKVQTFDKAEINRYGRLVLLSLTGFLVAGWFLSRAFIMTLFLLGGFAEVIFEMALRRGMISPRLPFQRVLASAGVMCIALVVLTYIVLRFGNLMR